MLFRCNWRIMLWLQHLNFHISPPIIAYDIDLCFLLLFSSLWLITANRIYILFSSHTWYLANIAITRLHLFFVRLITFIFCGANNAYLIDKSDNLTYDMSPSYYKHKRRAFINRTTSHLYPWYFDMLTSQLWIAFQVN